ncbi:hypothetical protein SEVIR_4G077300v4 [Setaria viridis]|nr:uncharacterized protein LOC101766628 [Setaria italica]XP_034589336.1 uncharacterized protein LOC117851605 [Setaria viridis]TKW20299.1 hypothetical protein SEVIR_4G077300v2 [Setaria viridis]
MELRMAPASPPTPPPAMDFRLDSAATSPYATAPSSPRGRLVRDEGTAGGLFLTAPPSPNPFDLLPPATPRLTGANPFDLFQHFTSAPASPRRAAAIYAHFAEGNGGDGEEDDDGDEEFQPRGSYATGGSSVPFDWEERPGTPKRGLGGGAAANEAAWDTDFEFGTIADKAAPAETLTTADELFEEGKIRPLKPRLKTAEEPKVRPLKPPPGLLDGGSVASSPRSPMARGGMRSPRRRSRVGSGVDFDPFAAALLEATKAPSPLGGKEANGGVAPGSPPKKLATRPASRSTGWRRWRLSDLLLFRSSSDGAGANNKQEPIFKPAQQFDAPVKKAFAQPAMTIKAGGKGDDMGKANKHGNRSAAAAAESVAGCARLSPLQRLAKGLGSYSWHYGRGMAAPATKG